MKFETALRMRNAAYRDYLTRERQMRRARAKVQKLDDKCNSIRDITHGNAWEPKFPRAVNFSGMED